MVLGQIGTFSEFASWLFGVVTLGIVSLFWWWISSTVRSISKRLESLDDIIRDMRLMETSSKIERANIVKELERQADERAKSLHGISELREELATIRTKMEMISRNSKS